MKNNVSGSSHSQHVTRVPNAAANGLLCATWYYKSPGGVQWLKAPNVLAIKVFDAWKLWTVLYHWSTPKKQNANSRDAKEDPRTKEKFYYFNSSCPDPGRREKNNFNFYFTTTF